MRKLLAIFVLSFPALAFGQYSAVTAQVKDVNGSLYQNCVYNTTFVGQSSLPGPYLISGSVFQTDYSGARCDGSANLIIRLPQNAAISPTPSQWQINFCDQTGKYCGSTLITISGSSQDITANLTAVAPILPSSGGASGGKMAYLTAGNVVFSVANPIPAGTSTCPSGSTPFGWVQNAAGVYQTQFSIDPTQTSSSDSTFPGGLVFCRSVVFNSGAGPNPVGAENAQAFSVVGKFTSIDKFLTQYHYSNDPSDSSTYNLGNLGALYGDFEINGTSTLNVTFVSTLRFRNDDNKTGGSKPRAWSVYQGATSKTNLYDITNCAVGLASYLGAGCYTTFFGDSSAELPSNEDETGAVYDVFAGGTADAGAHALNATGNVFHALVQSSTSNRFANTNGFTSEDFGTSATAYDMLLKGVNAAGTPSGFAAAIGPFSFGTSTHPSGGRQVEISGGNLGLGADIDFYTSGTHSIFASVVNSEIALTTANSSSSNTGSIVISTGEATGATHNSGDITIATNDSGSAAAGDIFLNAGASATTGGDAFLNAGTGSTADGVVTCGTGTGRATCALRMFEKSASAEADMTTGVGAPSGTCGVPRTGALRGAGNTLYFRTDAPDLSHFLYGCLASTSTWTPFSPLSPSASPQLVGSSTLSAQTGALGPTTLFTVGAATTSYLVTGRVYCDTSVATATVALTIGYTDSSNTAQSVAPSAAACTTLGASSFAQISAPIRAKNGTTITYSTSVANSPNYDVSVQVYQQSTN